LNIGAGASELSFHAEGHKPWLTAGVSSDMNQSALMTILDGFQHWLPGQDKTPPSC
jgi:2-isopropylmalate synthase